jgi:hypothetical protein
MTTQLEAYVPSPGGVAHRAPGSRPTTTPPGSPPTPQARALNEAGIPCPSAADPGRNSHRAGLAWSLTTVRAILANPRYTGRQVWNRQPSAMDLIDPANTGLGHRQVQRWGLPEGWVISARPSHPALVTEEDFIAVQGIRAPRENAGKGRQYLWCRKPAPRHATRWYSLIRPPT